MLNYVEQTSKKTAFAAQKARSRKSLTRVSFKLFTLFDRLGLHVLPKHYYTPVADYHWLKRHKQIWTGRANLSGIHWDLDEQIQWLSEICPPYYDEVAGLEFYERTTASAVGLGFGPIESQVLHCFIRAYTPPNIVEIGSGVSTACMAHASDLNRREGRKAARITCIEPEPKKALYGIQTIRLLPQPCQTVPNSVFEQLQAGDLLFIDSSHSVKLGSDVIRIYLDIIPRLAPGVFIQIHDIFLPYLYQRSVLSSYFGWQETSLVLALLINNKKLSVLTCLSALHYDRTDQLRALLPDYQPRDGSDGLDKSSTPDGHFPASLWLRT